jgi:hypothetical protein
VGEPRATTAEMEAAERETSMIIVQFENQISWQGVAHGLTGLQINVILNSIKDPVLVQLQPLPLPLHHDK